MNGQRRELPNRRAHDLRDFVFRGLKYSVGVGRFFTGEIAEIFISCNKPGSTADETAKDAAIVVSIALQHGASLQTLAHSAMRDDSGNPTTAVGHALMLLQREATP